RQPLLHELPHVDPPVGGAQLAAEPAVDLVNRGHRDPDPGRVDRPVVDGVGLRLGGGAEQPRQRLQVGHPAPFVGGERPRAAGARPHLDEQDRHRHQHGNRHGNRRRDPGGPPARYGRGGTQGHPAFLLLPRLVLLGRAAPTRRTVSDFRCRVVRTPDENRRNPFPRPALRLIVFSRSQHGYRIRLPALPHAGREETAMRLAAPAPPPSPRIRSRLGGRALIVLAAAAAVPVGPATVPAPATGGTAESATAAAPVPATGASHCALVAGSTTAHCFATYRAAVAYGTGGRVTDAPVSARSAALDPTFARTMSALPTVTAAASVLLGTEYANANFGGASLSLFGAGQC